MITTTVQSTCTASIVPSPSLTSPLSNHNRSKSTGKKLHQKTKELQHMATTINLRSPRRNRNITTTTTTTTSITNNNNNTNDNNDNNDNKNNNTNDNNDNNDNDNNDNNDNKNKNNNKNNSNNSNNSEILSSLPIGSLETSYKQFLKNNPTYKEYTGKLDECRSKEYSWIDTNHHIYLDYTGASLYSAGQIQKHTELLQTNLMGNPHSSNPTSQLATSYIEKSRSYAMSYFNIKKEDYVFIFTANASAALKLVGESYPFKSGDHLIISSDNHNSVNGIREFAKSKGAKVHYVPVDEEELRLDEGQLKRYFEKYNNMESNEEKVDTKEGKQRRVLFAYPAQSNFSGVRHPLKYIEMAHAKGWDVLLDAAAFVPSNRLDFDKYRPDFVSMSFYKIFGYPTGIGALIVKRSKLEYLKRPWFAGGTVVMAGVKAQVHILDHDETKFEDGTVNFLNIPAVEIGLRHINEIGIHSIHKRIKILTQYLLGELQALKYTNGQPVVVIYGPKDTKKRGGTVAMNVLSPDGKPIPYQLVEEAANQKNISLRTGCFCNPGAGEIALRFNRKDMKELAKAYKDTKEEFARHDRPLGAVRVSLGLMSNYVDVYKFMVFMRGFVEDYRKASSGSQSSFGFKLPIDRCERNITSTDSSSGRQELRRSKSHVLIKQNSEEAKLYII